MTLKILYVEDDPVNAQIVQRSLHGDEFDLVCALDAQEGVRKAEEIIPDIILMDVDLPGQMNGIDAVELIKSDPKMASIPIVFLTADQTPNTVRRCQEVGGTAFLLKPIRRNLLLERIREVAETSLLNLHD